MLSSVIGHEQLKKKLIIRLKEHPTGVYLFCGPSSIGKRTTAFEFSKRILCLTGDARCGCPSCERFKTEHPDFLCVGQQEKIKVKDVTLIKEFSSTTPMVSDKKIIIIDNAHEITSEAAHRLLKLLEEPPPNFSFFLITSEPRYLIPTIQSRCVKYEFGNLSREELTTIMKKKLGFTPKKAEILGYLAADSSMDVFSNAGLYLKYRELAVEFMGSIKTRPLIDSIDFVDKVDKDDLPLFTDMVVLILTDFLLLKNRITDITNRDKVEKFTKIAAELNDKALIFAVGLFTQIKRYMYLNINLNLPFKNALIKSYPYFSL